MNLTITSQFRPFTYDEMVKPLVLYKEAYDKMELDYSDLVALTEVWKDIANRTDNPIAYEMYNRYSNDLLAVTADFSRGMTLSNRGAMLNMKRRYALDIAPIARADAARQEARKYRRETKARDNTVLFKVEDMSIDDFLHGKEVSDEYISGKDILARTSAKSEALGKALFSDPEFGKILDGQKYQITQYGGMTPEVLYYVINNLLDNPNISDDLKAKLQGFRQIIDDELTNVADWGDKAKQYAFNMASTGMYAGLAKPTYQFIENGEYMTRAQREQIAISNKELDLKQQLLDDSREAMRRRALIGEDGKPTGLYYDPALGTVVDAKGNIPNVKNGEEDNVASTINTTSNKKSPREKPKLKDLELDKTKKEYIAPMFFDALLNNTSKGLDYKREWDGNLDDAVMIFEAGKIKHHDKPISLSPTAMLAILSRLPKGATMSDIDIYVDHDIIGDSHYFILDTRLNKDGSIKKKASSDNTGNTGTNVNENEGME